MNIPPDVLESLHANGATELQIELFRRCAELNEDEYAETLGSVMRLMLDPKMDFWDALHKAFEVKETGFFMPKPGLLN